MSTTTTGRIPPGVDVEWDTHGPGGWKRKRGWVLGYVEPGANAYMLVPQPWLEFKSRVRFQAVSAVPRYLVAVPRRSGRPDFYAPLASVLERDNEEAIAP